MISIIICSGKQEISSGLQKNIEDTIGAPYEIICIDNSKGKYGMCSAYKDGVRGAKGEFLCFMHEDVVFHSKNWGQMIIDHFKDKSVGVLGVMGGHFIPKTPTGWWEPGVTSENFICVLPDGSNNKVYIDRYRNDDDGVVAVDGAFMCFPRHIFKKIYWDASSFPGFHCYDLDICLQAISYGYKVQIAWDIVLEHRSSGSFNRQLVQSRRILFKKWKHLLPIQRGVEMTDDEIYLHSELARLREFEIEVKNSFEYKIGRFLLHPIRRIYDLFRKNLSE